MIDKFSQEVEKLKKMERSLRSDMTKRNEQEQRSLPVSILEAGIRGQFEEIERVIKLINNTEINSARNLSQNEVNRRLGIIQELTNNIIKLKTHYEMSIAKSLMEKNKQNLLLTSEAEKTHITDNISNGEVLKMQEEKIKKQDGMLDEIHHMLKGTKKANTEMADEIRAQTPMLKDIEKNIDKVQSKMTRAQGRLNQYFDKSSNGCMMTTLCIEIVLLLVIVLVL